MTSKSAISATATTICTSRCSPTSPMPTPQSLPGTPSCVAAARRRGRRSLNERHGRGRFFLFHRERRWNAAERRWMGWERKRGKLEEFNRAACAARPTPASSSRTATWPCCRRCDYVITLDSDTQLPMDAAARLVGTLAHPLNRPRFDPSRRTRDRGLRRAAAGRRRQPREREPVTRSRRCSPVTSASIPTPRRSPTSTRISFTKAATSARASTTSMRSKRRSPAACPRTGCSATICSRARTRGRRCAPTSSSSTTIPAHYLAFAARQHRWARGDWQIARWLWRTVPDADGATVPNVLPVMRAVEDPRQPPPQPARPGAGRAAHGGVDGPARLAGLWTALALLVLAFPVVRAGRPVAHQSRPRRAAAHARRRRARERRR